MPEVVVIGAGLAGASTAYALSRAGLRVTVLERERQPGVHASGRNAAMVRHAAGDALLPLLAEGGRFLRRPPADLGEVGFRRCGSLLLGCGDTVGRLRDAIPALRAHGVRAEWTEPRAVHAYVPLTEGGDFDGALYTFDDGVVDVAALLAGYLRAARAAGAALRLDEGLVAIDVRAGAVRGVCTSHGRTIPADAIVNAAGAWALGVSALAGASAPPLRPKRRHLMITDPLAGADAAWPVVWDESHGLYFRPESGGLLISPCDETPHAAGDVSADAAAVEHLAGKLARFLPRLTQASVKRTWAGLRTLTPDGNFVIGEDPIVRGFFWCAGLGGHGVAASAAVGRLTADAVLGRPVPRAHSPARFLAPA